MPAVAVRVDGDSGDEMLDVGVRVGDVGVSVDDRWKRKGFSSTLSVVTAISIDNEKVLDVAIISKSCKCYTSTKKLPLLCYETWKLLIMVILTLPVAIPDEEKKLS